ncbi:septal ring lytic transglycosylase RlpA family protein [Aquimonas voraii]|uniref:Endolytic peptidoglycan transglycosylase RlpA n=1 Tax=Aquimonas voraii TaxID=265719 RepID=A0A1G6W2Y9_9GAMM|nr:septal ring lytic transglycosylase RlpA family protein [Aquimonas voraii]SDD60211.1 rare lipoprotein A [Aquimonas voraii]
MRSDCVRRVAPIRSQTLGRPVPALLLAVLLLLLAGCAGGPAPRPPEGHAPISRPDPSRPRRPPSHGEPAGEQGGGLYAPHIRDGGPEVPPDVSGLPEPVPRAEPRARYGNHSPYVVLGRRYHVMDSAEGYVERGVASWYGTKFHGRPTSSFEPYDMYAFTAAHKTLPLPTYARVTNLENGRSVIVRINDRGPFHADRLIDLSYAAAVKLGIHIRGTGPVEVRAIVPRGMHAGVGEAPPAARAAGAPPAAEPPPPMLVEAGDVLLQVGSYAERANARRVQDQLERAGLRPVRIERAEVGSGTVYRVRIGPIDVDRQTAVVERVQSLGLGTPRPVRP